MRVARVVELVAAVARGEHEADPLDGALLEDRLVRGDEAVVDRRVRDAVDDDERRLAPRVGDDRRLVVVHDLRQLQPAGRRRSSSRRRSRGRSRREPSRARPRRRAPARRTSRCRRRRRRSTRPRRTLRSWNCPRENGRSPWRTRVLVRVREQRRRVVRVGDRDGLAAAEVLRAAEPVDAVGAAELVRVVAAHGVRECLVLELRQRLRRLLAVVARARRGVDEGVRRAEVRRLHRVAERAEPGDRGDEPGERVGHRHVRDRSLRLRAVDEIVGERGAERGRDRRRTAGDGDEVIVRPDRLDAEARLREPLRHLAHLVGGRRVLRRVLVGRDVLAVLRARRIADGLRQRVELSRVPRRDPDPRVHERARRDCGGLR